jgi:hypothetical protein
MMEIRDWKDFAKKVRPKGCNLLKRLDEFPNAILVTGCQRSGTTILSRIITQSEGMTNYWFGEDDELDAALILGGIVEHHPRGRYCFQTTYLNDCYHEYFQHRNKGHKIIFILRNPYSVVYSMRYNWKRFALNQLFIRCGMPHLNNKARSIYNMFGTIAFSMVVKACYSYVGKISQAFELREVFNDSEICFVEYDLLIKNRHVILPRLYEYIELPYKTIYAEKFSTKSLNKADKLSVSAREKIDTICLPVYERVKKLIPDTMRA